MKKTLVALATLAVAGGAFAQSGNARAIENSGVTIFGVIDTNITQFTQEGGGSVVRMQGEGRNESSRLGFRGMEDMGGGWGAGFWMEAGLFADSGAGSTTTANNTSLGQTALSTGTNNTGSGKAAPDVVSLGGTQGLTFNRAATLSLINKNVGELRLGRDYAPTFWNLTVFDPFGTVGVGAHTNVALGSLNVRPVVSPPGNPSPQVRTSNSIGWLSNDINGFRIQLQTALSEQISNCTDITTANGNGTQTSSGPDSGGNLCQAPAGNGKYIGSRLQYNSGPLALAAAYGKTTYANAMGSGTATGQAAIASPAAAYVGDYTAMNLAGAYTMGATKLMAQYGKQTVGDYISYYGAGSSATAAPITGMGVITNGVFTGNTSVAGVSNVTQRTVTHTLLGLTHQIDAWTLKASYATAKMTGGQVTNTGGTVGTAAGAATGGTLKAVQNIEDGASQKMIAVGFVYDFSKRTAMYGTYATQATKGQNAYSSIGISSQRNLNVGDSVTASGVDLGLRHRF